MVPPHVPGGRMCDTAYPVCVGRMGIGREGEDEQSVWGDYFMSALEMVLAVLQALLIFLI
jgi:hypothetical protein